MSTLSSNTPGVTNTRSFAPPLGRWHAKVLPPLVAFATVLVIWHVVTSTGWVPQSMLASPIHLAGQINAHRGDLFEQALPTLKATLLGTTLSIFASLAVAALLDFMPLLRRGVLPLLVVSQTLPMIALAPLVVLWFGFGLLPKVLLVAFLTFFPMAIALLQGFDSADPQAQHMLRTMGASSFGVFRMIRLP